MDQHGEPAGDDILHKQRAASITQQRRASPPTTHTQGRGNQLCPLPQPPLTDSASAPTPAIPDDPPSRRSGGLAQHALRPISTSAFRCEHEAGGPGGAAWAPNGWKALTRRRGVARLPGEARRSRLGHLHAHRGAVRRASDTSSGDRPLRRRHCSATARGSCSSVHRQLATPATSRSCSRRRPRRSRKTNGGDLGPHGSTGLDAFGLIKARYRQGLLHVDCGKFDERWRNRVAGRALGQRALHRIS